MSGAVTATSQPIIPPSSSTSSVYGPPRIIQWRVSSATSLAFSLRASRDHAFSSSYLKLTRHGWSQELSRYTLRCNSSTTPGGPGPGLSSGDNKFKAYRHTN